MTKALTKKEDTEFQAAKLDSATLAQFGEYDTSEFKDIALDVDQDKELFKNDILIPKVWLVQAMSEMRKKKEAEEGQFVDSQSGELLADLEQELKFIVLKTFKRWQTFEVVGDKKNFVSSEIMTLENAKLAYQETVEGKQLTRRQVISAYVLLEKDAIKGIDKPYIIDFAASSKLAGRKMISDIATLNKLQKPSFLGWFSMTCYEQSFGEKDTAFVKDVKFGGAVPQSAVKFLANCRRNLDSLEDQIEIDDADVIDAAKGSTKKANSNVNAEASGDAGI